MGDHGADVVESSCKKRKMSNPFTKFVPKNVGDHDEKRQKKQEPPRDGSFDARLNQHEEETKDVFEEVLGPNSNSMELMSSFFESDKGNRTKAGVTQQHKKKKEIEKNQFIEVNQVARQLPQNWNLVESFSCESDMENCFDWSLDYPLPGQKAVAMSYASSRVHDPSTVDCTIELCKGISRFEHPHQPLPQWLVQGLTKEKQRQKDSYHCQFRMDGSMEVGGDAGSQQEQKQQPKDSSTRDESSGTMFASFQQRSNDTKSSSGEYTEDQQEDFIHERRLEWGVAFRSLYRLLMNGLCKYFYYIDANFVGLFIAEGVLGNCKESPACAILSRSTPSLRTKLSRCMVEFDCPLDASIQKSEAEIDVELQDELKAYSKSASNFPTKVAHLARSTSYEDDARSLLRFVGKQNVAGLYGVLWNMVVKRAGTHAVPKLLAPVLFENSVCQTMSLTKPKKIGNVKSESKTNWLQFKGHVMPTRFTTILKALNQMHPESPLKVELTMSSHTQYFNEVLKKIVPSHPSVLSAKTRKVTTFQGFNLENEKVKLIY